MNRRLALLLALILAALAPLAGTTLEPDSYYRAVVACDRPANFPDAAWQVFSDNVRNADNGAGLMRIEGNALLLNFARIRGGELSNTLGKNFQGLVPRLVSAEKLGPSQAELDKAKAEQEAKLKAQAAQGNGPLTEADMKGKPVYNAGSPEAEAQMRESAREQDKAVARFKQSGAPGNGPISGEGLIGKPVKNTGAFSEDDDDFAGSGAEKSKSATKPADFPEEEEDKRPLSQRIMNRPANPAPRGNSPAASTPSDVPAGTDAAAEQLVPTSGNKYSKPIAPPPQKGTKKEDTLFRDQKKTPVPPKSE